MELLKSVLHAPSIQEQFSNVLKDHKDAFVTSIIDLYNSDSQLQTCNPNQVVAVGAKRGSDAVDGEGDRMLVAFIVFIRVGVHAAEHIVRDSTAQSTPIWYMRERCAR